MCVAKHWRPILVVSVLSVIAAVVYVLFLATPRFQATSTIYIPIGSSSAIDLSDLGVGTELAGDYARLLDLREVHEDVIKSLRLTYEVDTTRSMMSVSNDEKTRMLDITVTSSDPEEAARMANEFARVGSSYIAKIMGVVSPNIISEARVPTYQVFPNKRRIVFLAFVISVMLCCDALCWYVLSDNTVKTEDDIRRVLGIPTLAIVPKLGEDDSVSEPDPSYEDLGQDHWAGEPMWETSQLSALDQDDEDMDEYLEFP